MGTPTFLSCGAFLTSVEIGLMKSGNILLLFSNKSYINMHYKHLKHTKKWRQSWGQSIGK